MVVSGSWCIDDSYIDDRDREHRVSPEVVTAVAAAIGSPEPDAELRAPLVVGPRWRPDIDGVVECEDGDVQPVAAGHTIRVRRVAASIRYTPALPSHRMESGCSWVR